MEDTEDTEDNLLKMKEIWRPVMGYEGLYEVSNMGRVMSFITHRFMTPSPDTNGYYRVCLSKNGYQKCVKVHRLVAQAFIENTLGLPEVNHIDEDKSNNSVTNLEWCDRKYNVNYGTAQERRVKTNIKKGLYTGLTRQEYCKKYRQENIDYFKNYNRKYYLEHRKK